MAAPATAVRIEPTEAQLRAAWARIRRATWPATFEASMQDAICAALVRMNALHPPAPIRHVSSGPAAPLAAATPTQLPARRVAPAVPPPGYVDHKRAAAGDRDD